MLWILTVGGHEAAAFNAHELCAALAHRMGEHAACVLNYVI